MAGAIEGVGATGWVGVFGWTVGPDGFSAGCPSPVVGLSGDGAAVVVVDVVVVVVVVVGATVVGAG